MSDEAVPAEFGLGLAWGAVTDVGRVRQANEDSLLARDGLFVVADGMGGHSAGEVASALAVEVMSEVADEPRIEDLVGQVVLANEAIVARAGDEPALAGMGTTLCALARLGPGGRVLGLVNVGDSRIYRCVDGDLTRITEDHSLVETMVREGRLRPEEAAGHPHRNVLTRALGISEDVAVDYWELPVRRGVRLLLCSDGLVGELADDEIEAVLVGAELPGDVATRLVAMANERGGHDNITVVVVDVVDGPDDAPVDFGETRTFGSRSEEIDDDDDSTAVTPVTPVVQRHQIRLPRPRLAAVAAAVAVALVVALILVGRYARDNYFVGLEETPAAQSGPTVTVRQVVVFKGRPGGVLWFDPTVEERTVIVERDLTDALLLELEQTPEFDSLEDALEYVSELEERIADSTVTE